MKEKIDRVRKALRVLVRYLVASVSLAIVFYIVFALFFSTAEERMLERENKLYRTRYAAMQEKQQLIGDVVDLLMIRDDEIYGGLFETSAPTPDELTSAVLVSAVDSLPSSEGLVQHAARVEENFAEVFRLLEARSDSIPPLSLPLKDISYVQAGASVGPKANPLYKRPMQHTGLDLIAPLETPVLAAAPGVVSAVERSRKGLGNVVVVNHENGYSTRYCLLGDISVNRGQRVRRGHKLGTVGISSSVSAPHLHFEVLFRGEVRDPLNYLFASITPEEYARMLYMGAFTAQSMD